MGEGLTIPPSSYGKRKGIRRDTGATLAGMSRTCGKFFLDSGAHTLFNEYIRDKPTQKKYSWFVRPSGRLSKAFRKWMDRYAEFIHKYCEGVDHYVTVDAIYNPIVSMKSFNYLRLVHKLNPIPVIHHKTPLGYVEEYLDMGCKIIGIGGMGQDATKQDYIRWADRVFQYLCPPPHYLPVARVHGFAVTTYSLLLRYPWWSVDSSSWAKAAGYGAILVPHRRNNQFDFSTHPYSIGMSDDSPKAKKIKRHYKTLADLEQQVVRDWLNKIDVPLGKVDDDGKTIDYGVQSEYNARAVACLKFFTELAKWLGPWPRPFKARTRSRFDDDDISAIDLPPIKPKRLRPTHIAFSGGSPIPECNLDHPTVMLSYLLNVGKNGKPDARFRKLLKCRRRGE